MRLNIKVITASLLIFISVVFIANITVHATEQEDGYTVSYEANGGSGHMDDASTKDGMITLDACAFSRCGYVFKGWATSENGLVKYEDGAEIDVVRDTVLYAIWEREAPVITVESSDAGISLTWSIGDNATYELYRKDYTNDTDWEKIYTGTDASYIDSNVSEDTVYLYKVRFYNGTETSGFSDAVQVKWLKTLTWNDESIDVSELYAEEFETNEEVYFTDITTDSVYLHFNEVVGATGYEISLSTTEDFAEVTVVETEDTDYIVSGLSENTTYYFRIRSFCFTDKNRFYSGYSETREYTTTEETDITTVDCDYAIEADVYLSGEGTGYHSKIVIGTSVSAVSFGIQFDEGGVAPYTGKTVALLENIHSNDTGGQEYPRMALLDLTEAHKLLLTLNNDGTGSVYIDGTLVGSFTNTEVVSTGELHFWVEGAARYNGDTVHSEFQNIKYRIGSNIYEDFTEDSNIIDVEDRNNDIICSESVEQSMYEVIEANKESEDENDDEDSEDDTDDDSEESEDEDSVDDDSVDDDENGEDSEEESEDEETFEEEIESEETSDEEIATVESSVELAEGEYLTIRFDGTLSNIVSDWDYDYESASSIYMMSRTATVEQETAE
ncbi:MAG: InlB B-repeat-containing protein [Lachnospiraceae bacterium]|nr:InlB B-repeat-containing protein [Lachnospiraceae bacterium]